MVNVYVDIELSVDLLDQGGLHSLVQMHRSRSEMSDAIVEGAFESAEIWDDERVGGCCSSPA